MIHRTGAESPSAWSRRGRAAAVGCLLTALLTAGCSVPRRAVDTSLKYLEAKAAYSHSCPPGMPLSHQRHYERGWRCGYTTVAKGGRSCPPAVPPEQYWAHKYESPEGRQYVVTWYNGWRAGAAAAECYGVDRYHRVPAIQSDCTCESSCSCAGSGVLPPPDSYRCGCVNGCVAPAPATPTPGVTRLPAVDEPEVVSPPAP